MLDQAKNHEIKGDGFDQLEKKLGSAIAPKARKNKEPTKDQLQSLVNLYNKPLKIMRRVTTSSLIQSTKANISSNMTSWLKLI